MSGSWRQHVNFKMAAAEVVPDERVFTFKIHEVYSGDTLSNDKSLTLLAGAHGLYDLAEAVFDACAFEDSVFDHLWTIQVRGKSYSGPFSGLGQSKRECSGDTVASRVPLAGLGLSVGDQGAFHGESGQFAFTLQGVAEAPAHGRRDAYPAVSDAASAAWSASQAADRRRRVSRRLRRVRRRPERVDTRPGVPARRVQGRQAQARVVGALGQL